MSVGFVKASRLSFTPQQSTSGSVGSDLSSVENYILYPNKATLFDCEIHMQIPKGDFGLISGRSSFALEGVLTHTGIIDNDYAGTIFVYWYYR